MKKSHGMVPLFFKVTSFARATSRYSLSKAIEVSKFIARCRLHQSFCQVNAVFQQNASAKLEQVIKVDFEARSQDRGGLSGSS